MIARITRDLVPVALNLYTIRDAKGDAGDFYRKIAKVTTNQYQGLYVVTADGKVLATHSKEPAKRQDWPKVVLKFLDDALTKYGKVSPRPVQKVDALALHGLGEQKDGGITLAVYARPMVLGLDRRGLGEVSMDAVKLTSKDVDNLTLSDVPANTTWTIPGNVVKKLHRALSPASDQSTLAKIDEVTAGTLKGKVESVKNGIASLSFTGSIRGVKTYQFDPHKGKKIHATVTFGGVGTCEAKSGKLLSFTLVGDGTYTSVPPYNQPQKYGVVVEWKAK